MCILFCCYSLFGCVGNGEREIILSAEKMVAQYPDSAYRMLKDIDINDLSTKKEKADFALVYTEALYKNRIRVTSDSLIRIAYVYYTDKQDYLKAGKTNYYMAKVSGSQDSIQKATKYLIDAEQYALKEGDNDLLGLIYSELGYLYRRQRILPQGLLYYNKARICFQLSSNHANENYMIGDIAKCFSLADQKDSALYYYSEANARATMRNDKEYLNYLKRDQIPIYFDLNQMEKAKNLISELYSLDSNQFLYYFALGDYFDRQNEIGTAQYYFMQLLKNTSLTLTLKEKGAIYYKLRLGQEKTGDYKQAYEYALIDEKLSDSLRTILKNNYILEIEEKYRNEQLINQNHLLQIDNNHKQIIHIILIFIVVMMIFIMVLINNYRKKIIRRDQEQIDAYIILIESLKEEYKTSRNDLIEKLNEKNGKELRLKSAIGKRLDIIKQLTDLSFKYGDNEKTATIFSQKIKALMNVNVLTRDTLVDLLEIVNMDYYGIIDFLKKSYNLSENELILCCFICSEFTSQEMSVLYNITVANLYVRCHRLSGKMKLNVSLTAFLKETLTKLKEEHIEAI